MPNRQRVRAQTRTIGGHNPADKPGHKTQLSTVTVEGCEHLMHPNELRSMAQHHIEAQGDILMLDHVDDRGSTLVYYFTTKGVAISLARRIEDAFKHHHPVVKVLTPKDHLFQRITVSLLPAHSLEETARRGS